VEICFQCGEITIAGGGKRTMPRWWRSTLESFIISLGMNPAPEEVMRGVTPPHAMADTSGSP
jgi:hypothetical protein